MAKKQNLDICIIGMNDTGTASMVCMEDHACQLPRDCTLIQEPARTWWS